MYSGWILLVSYHVFLQTLWEAINEEVKNTNRKPLLLSAAVGVGQQRIDNSYEVPEIVK